ncbi:hypothetical protein B9Z19DRAFT_1085660 [Tuber borchii]|uniref:Uncharacterized protein n=1 Tax=Tuber borchii TaxID=42251 RepID=A0A2T6ZQD5_TUBBO|nr:hypothetical protein B9Z19DRAFT_1085660 [Tuber borchii]
MIWRPAVSWLLFAFFLPFFPFNPRLPDSDLFIFLFLPFFFLIGGRGERIFELFCFCGWAHLTDPRCVSQEEVLFYPDRGRGQCS